VDERAEAAGSAGVAEWTVQRLDEALDRGDELFILDVRNAEEFARTPIEGRAAIRASNVPYFAMLEYADDDDLAGAIARYAQRHLGDVLPKEMPILTVCAKGGTSQLVAEGLQRLGYRVGNLAGGIAAWNDAYVARTAAADDAAAIVQIARPARGCLSYLIESAGRAAVIDPARHIDQYVTLANERKLTIDLVIDTHAHADHVSGGPALAARIGAPYYLHPYDAIHPVDLVPARVAYTPLSDGLSLTLGGARLQVLWIPGHTLGNTAVLVDGRWLLAGDSIFIESIARPDLGGRADTWTELHYQSLRRLLAMPDETLILPGHFSRRSEAGADGVFGRTLGELRASNHDLAPAADDSDAFAKYIQASLPAWTPEYVEIKRINAGLRQAHDEQLAELETGKNQCGMARADGAAAPA
jgi:glyoxylase-like metal-dependent hydrolase (beta-lactamase superfamily II)/rhodanese-related sulfurtransferase